MDHVSILKRQEATAPLVHIVQVGCQELLSHFGSNNASPDKHSFLIPVHPLLALTGPKADEIIGVRIHPFSVCVIARGSSFHPDSSESGQALLISVSSNWLACPEGQCLGKKTTFNTPIDVIKNIDIPPLIQSLQRQLVISDCPIDRYLEMTVAYLLARVFWQKSSDAGISFDPIEVSSDAIHDIIEAIEQLLGERILVKDFARSIGMPPRDYQRQLNIGHAKSLSAWPAE